MVRPKIAAGSGGSAAVGGKIVSGSVRLCGSPTVVAGSTGMAGGRVKIARGAGGSPGRPLRRVCRSLAIAAGSAGIPGGRAKAGGSGKMLVRSRKIAYRCVAIAIDRRADRGGLFSGSGRVFSRFSFCPVALLIAACRLGRKAAAKATRLRPHSDRQAGYTSIGTGPALSRWNSWWEVFVTQGGGKLCRL